MKAIEKKEEQLRDTQKLLDRVEYLKRELRKESGQVKVITGNLRKLINTKLWWRSGLTTSPRSSRSSLSQIGNLSTG